MIKKRIVICGNHKKCEEKGKGTKELGFHCKPHYYDAEAGCRAKCDASHVKHPKNCIDLEDDKKKLIFILDNVLKNI